MDKEKLKIFDRDRKEIGIAARDVVHRIGHWHETFHCWFTSREAGTDYIYFQLRSVKKREYPCLFDITAAGHLLADETVEDGVREIQEELGMDISLDELVPLGIFKCSIEVGDYIDNEFCHVFIHHQDRAYEGFKLQTEEVGGIMKAEFNRFYDLWMGKITEIEIIGFILNDDGKKVAVNEIAGKDRFTPNANSYYEKLVTKCREFLIGGGMNNI